VPEPRTPCSEDDDLVVRRAIVAAAARAVHARDVDDDHAAAQVRDGPLGREASSIRNCIVLVASTARAAGALAAAAGAILYGMQLLDEARSPAQSKPGDGAPRR